MCYLVLALVLLGALAGIMEMVSQRRHGEAPVVRGDGGCATCADPATARCEQACMMEAATKPVEYFDDEELDAFVGRCSDAYTDAEVSLFAEVLETLRPSDVRPWGRSLRLRGINLPDALKDEYAMLATQ